MLFFFQNAIQQYMDDCAVGSERMKKKNVKKNYEAHTHISQINAINGKIMRSICFDARKNALYYPQKYKFGCLCSVPICMAYYRQKSTEIVCCCAILLCPSTTSNWLERTAKPNDRIQFFVVFYHIEWMPKYSQCASQVSCCLIVFWCTKEIKIGITTQWKPDIQRIWI